MLDAICVFDEREPTTYTVFKFQKLSDAEIETFRQSLICPSCKQKAFFRKASKDGRAACFGSRYHHSDCVEFKPSKSRVSEEVAAVEVNQQLVDNDALIIDYSHKISLVKPIDTSGVEKSNRTASPKQSSVSEPKSIDGGAKLESVKVAKQGLEKLLLSLLRGSELAESELWVYTDDKYRWRAKNLFVNFADAEPTEKGAPRMYWGTISHCDKKMQWLNPSDCNDLGIPIADFKQPLFSKFDIQERRDLEGAGIILFGKCFWNKEKTRKIIQLWGKDTSRIAISKLED